MPNVEPFEFEFHSETSKRKYTMRVGAGTVCYCTCPGFAHHGHCKHAIRARAWLAEQDIHVEAPPQNLDDLWARFDSCGEATR